MPTKIIFLIALLFSVLNADKFSLAELCQKGIENNPKIKSFSYKSAASGSYYDQAVDQYKPHLSVSGQYGDQNYKYEYESGDEEYHGRTFNYQLTLKQPIYRAQLIEGMTDARERERLAKLQEMDEKAKLITQILQSTVELTRQKRIIAVLQKKVSVLEKAYENVMSKYELQMASSADKFQSLAMLQQSRSQLTQAEQMYNYNLYDLRLLVKYKDVEKYIDSLQFNVGAVEESYKKANLASIKRSIADNTRIKLDAQSVAIAKAQIALRDSASSPQVDAVLSYGDAGGTIDQVTRQNEARAMVTLNFPLYQGGAVDDSVKEAKLLYHAAREDAENTRLNIEISMEKAIQNIQGGLESVKAYGLAVDASQKYLEGMVQSYQSGVASLTDAYLAESDYRDNQIRLINSESDIFASLCEVYYYGGKSDFGHVKTLQNKFYK